MRGPSPLGSLDAFFQFSLKQPVGAPALGFVRLHLSFHSDFFLVADDAFLFSLSTAPTPIQD